MGIRRHSCNLATRFLCKHQILLGKLNYCCNWFTWWLNRKVPGVTRSRDNEDHLVWDRSLLFTHQDFESWFCHVCANRKSDETASALRQIKVTFIDKKLRFCAKITSKMSGTRFVVYLRSIFLYKGACGIWSHLIPSLQDQIEPVLFKHRRNMLLIFNLKALHRCLLIASCVAWALDVAASLPPARCLH